MTKHTMVTFQLHRKGVILIVIGCVFLAVLLVAVGYLAGSARARSSAKPAAAAPAAAAKSKPAAAPPAAPASQESFSLRVGLVTSEEEAKAEVARLAVKKLTATVIPVERNESEIVYEIHVGRYPDRRAAVDAAQLLRERGIDSAVVAAP
jgi:cell division septation protein DedD